MDDMSVVFEAPGANFSILTNFALNVKFCEPE